MIRAASPEASEPPLIGTVTELQPGLTDGVAMSDYLGDTAVSASRLWKLAQLTPAHLLEDLQRAEDPPTDPKELGSLLHTLVFERDEFEGRYVVMGQCEAKKGDGSRCENGGKFFRDGKSFCGVKGHDPYKGDPMPEGLHLVQQDLKETALRMEASLKRHPIASELLWCDARREVTGVWKDPVTGLWCRIRPDNLFEEPPTVKPHWHWSTANLKSTGKSAHPDSYWRDAERMGTWFKAGFYLLGLRELVDWEPQNFFYPVVESTGSHQVIVYRLDDTALWLGEAAARAALDTLAECVNSGEWPGYGNEVHNLKVSDWRTRHLHDTDFLDVTRGPRPADEAAEELEEVTF